MASVEQDRATVRNALDHSHIRPLVTVKIVHGELAGKAVDRKISSGKNDTSFFQP